MGQREQTWLLPLGLAKLWDVTRPGWAGGQADEPGVSSPGPFHHQRAGAAFAHGSDEDGNQRAKSFSEAGFFSSHYVSRIS